MTHELLDIRGSWADFNLFNTNSVPIYRNADSERLAYDNPLFDRGSYMEFCRSEQGVFIKQQDNVGGRGNITTLSYWVVQ